MILAGGIELSILSQLDPVHTPTSHFLKIHLGLGLPSDPLPSDFPTKTLYIPLHSPIHATCPAHLIHLDLNKNKISYNKVIYISMYSVGARGGVVVKALRY